MNLKKYNVTKDTQSIVFFIAFIIIGSFLIRLFLLEINHGYAQGELFFARCNDLFADYINPITYAMHRNPYFDTTHSPAHHQDPGIFYIICYLIARIVRTKGDISLQNNYLTLIIFFYLMTCVCLLIHLLKCLCIKYNVRKVVILPLLVSSVMLAAIERANETLFVASCIIYFVTFYDSESKALSLFSCLCLALAASLKIFPALFGFLYFKKRQYKHIALSASLCLLLFFLPFDHGIHNFHRFLSNSFLYTSQTSHSLFMQFLRGLSICSLVLSLYQRKTFYRLVLITFAVLMLSPGAGFYTALYFFPLVIILFSTQFETFVEKLLYFTMLLLLIPLQLPHFKIMYWSSSSRFMFFVVVKYVFIFVFVVYFFETIKIMRKN
ncbi:MAG: hypothetical protein K6E51_05400 [Treponema sp.]|nr:hypothetical protein [Treponema sp.]